MVTVQQWESGQVKLSGEYFEPVYMRPRNELLDRVIPNRFMAFRGVETGTYISPDFAEILE